MINSDRYYKFFLLHVSNYLLCTLIKAKVVTYINEVKHSPNVLTNKTPIAYESVYNLFQANFAKWEPRHGKFGFHYPWEKYLHIGEALRDLSATIICLKGCVESPKQVSDTQIPYR